MDVNCTYKVSHIGYADKNPPVQTPYEKRKAKIRTARPD
jgi:hypothetical protein